MVERVKVQLLSRDTVALHPGGSNVCLRAEQRLHGLCLAEPSRAMERVPSQGAKRVQVSASAAQELDQSRVT